MVQLEPRIILVAVVITLGIADPNTVGQLEGVNRFFGRFFLGAAAFLER